jgi:hypothetical protein
VAHVLDSLAALSMSGSLLTGFVADSPEAGATFGAAMRKLRPSEQVFLAQSAEPGAPVRVSAALPLPLPGIAGQANINRPGGTRRPQEQLFAAPSGVRVHGPSLALHELAHLLVERLLHGDPRWMTGDAARALVNRMIADIAAVDSSVREDVRAIPGTQRMEFVPEPDRPVPSGLQEVLATTYELAFGWRASIRNRPIWATFRDDLDALALFYTEGF